jgi:hypothetical protein
VSITHSELLATAYLQVPVLPVQIWQFSFLCHPRRRICTAPILSYRSRHAFSRLCSREKSLWCTFVANTCNPMAFLYTYDDQTFSDTSSKPPYHYPCDTHHRHQGPLVPTGKFWPMKHSVMPMLGRRGEEVSPYQQVLHIM